MLYINGTIERKDGKRMTQKRADKIFDEFLDWLVLSEDCVFCGHFTTELSLIPRTANTSGRAPTDIMPRWHRPKHKTPKRKAPKRKKKR